MSFTEFLPNMQSVNLSNFPHISRLNGRQLWEIVDDTI